jgi:ligand-binding SRPBCC domain-containing protein
VTPREEVREMRGTFHIEAPVEKVFDFFTNPIEQVELFPSTEIRELKKTEEGTGTYTDYHTTFFGIPMNAFGVITDFTPNKRIVEKSSSPMVGTWEYRFEPEGTGTKVVMEHRSRSFWDLPPVRTIGDVITTRMTDSYMTKVKEYLEGSVN